MKNLLLALVLMSVGTLYGQNEKNHYSKEIYVAVNGNDANPGTKGKPVATLEGARNLIRHYKSINAISLEGITVWIGKGIYE